MAFRCPSCGGASLAIDRSIELPPDSRSDEISLQTLSCERCGFRALAVYEESRRGGFGSESWDHTGYRGGAEEIESVSAAIAACPAPSDRRCPCDAHRMLSQADENGRWIGIEGETFALLLEDDARAGS